MRARLERNKIEHFEYYQCALEVENELADALSNKSMHLAIHVFIGDSNLFFYCEWSNFSKINTNLKGSNVVNSAARIMLHKVKHGSQPLGASNLPEYERDTNIKKISYKVSVLETPLPITI